MFPRVVQLKILIVGYFFENKTGNAVTINGLRYRDMLKNLFFAYYL